MNQKKVSIGLPVYNGSNYLKESIDSILSQSYKNIELIISDNGSDDASPDIIADAATRDSRIKSFRSNENKGAAWNYNKVFDESTGYYFKWAAHDDLIEEKFIESCVDILERFPEVVLCFSRWLDIDENAEVIGEKTAHPDSLSPEKITRFTSMIDLSHICEQIFGVMRRETLSRTRLIEAYSDSDRVLLAELCLSGPFYEIQKPLFYHRLHSASSVEAAPDRHKRVAWFDPSKKGVFFPFWRELLEYFKTPARTQTALREKLRCYREICQWGAQNRRQLASDVNFGLRAYVKKALRLEVDS